MDSWDWLRGYPPDFIKVKGGIVAMEKELTIKDAAGFLGISDTFVSSLVNRGILPHVVRFGKKVIPVAALKRRKKLAGLPIAERVAAGMAASPAMKATKQQKAAAVKKSRPKKAK